MRITANVNTQFYVTGSPRAGSPRTPTPVINKNYQKIILDSHLMWVSRQRGLDLKVMQGHSTKSVEKIILNKIR